MKPISIISLILIAAIVIGTGIALAHKFNPVVSAQPSVLISTQQASNATGIPGFSLEVWAQVNNFSQLLNHYLNNGGGFENPNYAMYMSALPNITQSYFEILKHNSTTFILGAVLITNSSINFNKIESLLVLLLNFNTSTYQTMNYAYGNISVYGVALGYANKTLFFSLVNGTSNNIKSAVSIIKDEYNTLKANHWEVPPIPSKLTTIPYMSLTAWGYVNFSAINLTFPNMPEMNFFRHHNYIYTLFNQDPHHHGYWRHNKIFKIIKSLNATSMYIGYYTNSTLHSVLTIIEANNETAVNETFTIAEAFAINYTTGTYDGAQYLISHVNNSSILYAIDGHYIVIEGFNEYVNNQFMLSVLGNELSVLGL